MWLPPSLLLHQYAEPEDDVNTPDFALIEYACDELDVHDGTLNCWPTGTRTVVTGVSVSGVFAAQIRVAWLVTPNR